ncbi:craniofacial development protein 2-like [Palaemon carinicauda]|uniref:craniofacial development protein 2-like n=1 Tax=Palaemon carinicauda TaxID=392227 RepID=UPI0035B5B7A8
MVNKTVSKFIPGYWAITERVMLMKIKGHPFNINIIEVYAPSHDFTEEEVDEFYNELTATQNNAVLTNTWFEKPPGLLWTWKSPEDLCRNQIDYITIKKRFRNAVLDTRTYPEIDCYSDHVPVVITLRVKLNKLRKRNTEKKATKTPSNRPSTKRIEASSRYELLNREEPLEEEELDRDWRARKEPAKDLVTK